jgi:DNA-binding transcriptional LysR family regulator
MLQVIAEAGSFAAAARQLGLVPSALTYRVRQIEDALDVLLFDRSARQATPHRGRGRAAARRRPAAAGHRCRGQPRAPRGHGLGAAAHAVVDGVISPHTMLELVEAFYAMSPPTRLKLRDGIMTGTREALTSGRADLAIGVSNIASDVAGLQQAPAG